MTDTICSVCDKPAFTAEEADAVERERDLERPMTCCWKADESQLFIHEGGDDS